MNETKQILCGVIRDLLPSYVEQLTVSCVLGTDFDDSPVLLFCQ